MINKWLVKVKAHHIWRFVFVLALAEIIGAFYLFIYLVSALAK